MGDGPLTRHRAHPRLYPSRWFQAGARISLCHWRLDSPDVSGLANLRLPAVRRKGYEKI